ncbi:hypothetical protein HDEF_1467 [Candidatus Hamiltonella defensa 5AT (Acyrthosiphon pisum)]|uniref:Uncharacterized protein n=1 Tax=Hamiltonella defensa subsp. Acyrthosiphon pisum (strain 5AT) TaxID=572265 RepID=C4K698_HAMD5|nr:hypothetical protein HDEF_1467 [Candidatus Hamiltonella defensa 5AT (Acyrthosiphon pisum)]
MTAGTSANIHFHSQSVEMSFFGCVALMGKYKPKGMWLIF